MKKSLSYISIIYFLSRAFFIGASFSLMLKFSKQDIWISLLLAFPIGFLFLFLIQYIASYLPEKNLQEKISHLFPNISQILIWIIILLFLFLTSLSFWNLSNLITSEFLNKTPKIVVGISFLIPLLMLMNKEEKIISRVSLILFYISIFLFLVSLNGLIFQIHFDNFKPILANPLTKSILPYLGFQVFPIFLILIFPNQEILGSIKKGYVISFLVLFINTIFTVGVLGVDLATIYQYPEFHILKRAYQGILTYRLENFLTIQWLLDIFIFSSVALKGCNQLAGFQKDWKIYLFPILTFLVSIFLFKDNTIANTFIEKYLMYLLPIFMIGLLFLLTIKVFYKKRRYPPIDSKNEELEK